MKTKKYFLLVIFFLLVVSLFYSSTNSIISVSDTATNKKNAADLEQETSSTPQLSQYLQSIFLIDSLILIEKEKEFYRKYESGPLSSRAPFIK